ncbi:MAG: hypothetical protein Q7J29_06765 [Stagnimonas sp.]|nr:hypothetical protein [Stagnimonas sp.]
MKYFSPWLSFYDLGADASATPLMVRPAKNFKNLPGVLFGPRAMLTNGGAVPGTPPVDPATLVFKAASAQAYGPLFRQTVPVP